MRDSFVFRREYAEAIKEMDAELAIEFIDALIDFALDGEAPFDKSSVTRSMILLVKDRIYEDIESLEEHNEQ